VHEPHDGRRARVLDELTLRGSAMATIRVVSSKAIGNAS
jgi:hypothetical protein